MINGVLLMTYISLLRKLKERCMEGEYLFLLMGFHLIQYKP